MTTFELLVREPGQAERYVTVDGTLDAGREVEGLLLADAETSRRHLRFTVDGDVLSVTDLGSTNGTTVNGSRIERPTPVADGDTIEVGDTVIVVASHREAVAPEHGAAEPAPGSTAAYPVEDSVPPPAAAPPPPPPPTAAAATATGPDRSTATGPDTATARRRHRPTAPPPPTAAPSPPVPASTRGCGGGAARLPEATAARAPSSTRWRRVPTTPP